MIEKLPSKSQAPFRLAGQPVEPVKPVKNENFLILFDRQTG
jgi:hypothetical protein